LPPPPPPPPLTVVATELDAATAARVAAARVVPERGGVVRVVLEDTDAVSGTHLDVVRGAYEGGAKVWECTADALGWLESGGGGSEVRGKRVADLGCGAGLLGVAAARMGAAAVLLQDYNATVLRDVTAVTVAANAARAPFPATAEIVLVGGGWGSLAAAAATPASAAAAGLPAWAAGGIDLILTSEVLYATDSYADLCAALCALLTPHGTAIIASKRFYYGVGGGVAAFTAAAASPPWNLTVTPVAVYEDGKSMIRDLLRVSRRTAATP